MSNKILFIGATGYIGGSVLLRLLNHPQRDSFRITILLRSAAKAKSFQSFGLNSIIGSLDDVALLECAASESDIVFQCANADHVLATKAILKGLKKRFEDTKTAPVLIHTSGTGVLIENSLGNFATKNIYSDLNISQIESLPHTQPHREVDVAIAAAGEEGYAKTFIVLPSTIWGVVSNAFTQDNLQNIQSSQIPYLIKYSMKRGSTPLIGIGANIWPHIENGEMADFYYILFSAIISGENPASGRQGFYFLENGDYTHKQVAEAIASALYKRGKVNNDNPVPLKDEEVNVWIQLRLGTNSRARGDRSRSLGWKPVKGTDDFIASIVAEVDTCIMKENGLSNPHPQI